MTRITLYYDCVSPYSWLAFEFLLSKAKSWNFELILKPIFLGAVMKSSGNQPPAFVPWKGQYMIKDLQRSSQLFGFKIIQHPEFTSLMFTSIKFMRLVVSVQNTIPEKTEQISRILWQRLWQQQKDPSPPYFREILNELKLSKEIQDIILQGVEEKNVQEILRKNTDECINYQAFGAPFYVVETKDGQKECFFGSDRFEQLAYLLKVPYQGYLPKL